MHVENDNKFWRKLGYIEEQLKYAIRTKLLFIKYITRMTETFPCPDYSLEWFRELDPRLYKPLDHSPMQINSLAEVKATDRILHT